MKKKCKDCGVPKTLDEFAKDAHSRLGVKPNCRQCVSAKEIAERRTLIRRPPAPTPADVERLQNVRWLAGGAAR